MEYFHVYKQLFAKKRHNFFTHISRCFGSHENHMNFNEKALFQSIPGFKSRKQFYCKYFAMNSLKKYWNHMNSYENESSFDFTLKLFANVFKNTFFP